MTITDVIITPYLFEAARFFSDNESHEIVRVEASVEAAKLMAFVLE